MNSLLRWALLTPGVAALLGGCSPDPSEANGSNAGPAASSVYPTEYADLYAAAAARLHNAEQMLLVGKSISGGSRKLTEDEVLAIRWLVSEEHLVRSEPGTGLVAVSVAISHFIVVGDERWSLFRDGLFPEKGSRLCRYAHPEHDFNTPDGRDGRSGSNHVELGLERLVNIWKNETQSKAQPQRE